MKIKELLKKLKRLLLVLFIYNKRLVKKPAFAVILILVPALVLGLNLFMGNDSGAVTVSVASESDGDSLAEEIMEKLSLSNSLIRFIKCESDEEATALVRNGKADSAWIFHKNLQKGIDRFTEHIHKTRAVVTVIQREETVLLHLTREKLSSTLYPYCTLSMYKQYVRDEMPMADGISDEQLAEYYYSVDADGEDLFSFGTEISNGGDALSYLTAPVRGLLVVLVTIAGLAVSLFYLQDSAVGRFDWVPVGRRQLISVGYHFVAVADVGIAALIAVFLSGVAVNALREVLLMILFIFAATGFCMLVRSLCTSAKLLGALLPVLAVILIVLSPVFFDLGKLRYISMILPTYHYLSSIYSNEYILPMVIYTLVVYAIWFAVEKLRER